MMKISSFLLCCLGVVMAMMICLSETGHAEPIFESILRQSGKKAAVDCPKAPSAPEDRRTNKKQLRIVSYNVEWLFEGDDGKSPRDPEDAKRHLAAVGDVVARIRPDIMAVQEVQNCAMLERLADYLADKGQPGYKAYMVKGTDTGTMQNVGLLTKIDPSVDLIRTADRAPYPMPGNRCNYNGEGGDYGVSKHLVTHFQIGTMKLSLVTFHLLAFPVMNQRCAQREAQATVLRRLVDTELQKGHEVVLLGDMNDYSDKTPDVNGNTPNSRVMKILRDGLLTTILDTSPEAIEAEEADDDDDDDGMIQKYEWMLEHLLRQKGIFANLTMADEDEGMMMRMTMIQKLMNHLMTPQQQIMMRTKFEEFTQRINAPQRYSAVYGNQILSQIDHILMSPGIWSKLRHAEIMHSYPPFEVSDHWPLVIDIDT